MALEQQTCPRRMSELGPWPRSMDLDCWETDRWHTDPEVVKKLHEAEDAKYNRVEFHRGPNNDLWLWGPTPARTCSFCGGVHPDDAIRLIEEGWEVESTDKNYKRYLHPPGFWKWHEQFIQSMREEIKVEPYADPTPPVKLYIQHFDDEHIKKFNAALDIKYTI